MAQEKTADQLVREAADDPALDGALRKDPRDVGWDDLKRLVQKFRMERAFVRGKHGNG